MYFTRFLLDNRADHNIFRGNICFSLYDILNLRSLGIRELCGVYHHIYGVSVDTHHHVGKALGLQQNLCRRLFLSLSHRQYGKVPVLPC